MESKGLELVKSAVKDKKKEKLIYILLSAVVILIASTYIFSSSEKSTAQTEDVTKTEKQSYIFDTSSEEQKLSSILSKINGVSEVSCYITYKDEGSIVPAKNKDDDVIFEENGSEKKLVIEKREIPKVEGVIIVGKGMENPDLQSKIATAVASVMNIGVYKVQVFSKGE
ncbi:MAG: hypothetical protein IJ809_01340 [Clostridia bacterium]|nr:hypothetical protein [Clostridia bacterium]